MLIQKLLVQNRKEQPAIHLPASIAWLFCLSLGGFSTAAADGIESWNINAFGHVELAAGESGLYQDDVSLGESALFVTGRLSSRWSVLTEISARPKKYREDTVKVERLRLRYDLTDNHWLSLGKMHTPVNHWNDTYHHGRVFFPSIDRPQTFAEFIPVHEIGVRASGENLGQKNVFYDIVIGSGQSAHDDAFKNGVKSFTFSAGFYPTNNLKWRFSYYRDQLVDHLNDPDHAPIVSSHSGHGAMHSGHGAMHADGSMHADSTMLLPREDLDYDLLSSSLTYEGERYEVLTELAFFRSEGSGWSGGIYQNVRYKVTDDIRVYALLDLIDIDEEEQHYAPGHSRKYGVGLEYWLGASWSLKAEYCHVDIDRGGVETEGNVFKLQMSFGF